MIAELYIVYRTELLKLYLLRMGQVLFCVRFYGIFRGCRASGERNAIFSERRLRRRFRPPRSAVQQEIISCKDHEKA